MARHNKPILSLDRNFAFGALFGSVLFLVFVYLSGITPQVLGKKGGGGNTQGNYDSSVFNLPEDASPVLLNTSFETNVDSNPLVPDDWIYHYDQPNRNTGVDCSVAKSGKCSYFIIGKKDSAIKQFVKVSGNAGDVVTISGWGKGLNVGDRAGHLPGVFWVQAWIHYADGTTKWDLLKKFPNGTYDFMQESASAPAEKPFIGITVFCRFDGTGEAWFDDISLTVTPKL